MRIVLLLLLFTMGCAGSVSHEQKGPLTAGDYTFTLQHDHRQRSYIVHVPPGPGPYPVVINFHGAIGSAKGHKEWTQMDKAADRHGFIAVYPNGTGTFQTWNAGACCGYARRKQVDDVGFTLALLKDLKSKVTVDHQRIYATGISNGGMMVYRLAAEVPEQFAAIAPVAATLALPRLPMGPPIPILHIHSLDDPRVPFLGRNGADPQFNFRPVEWTLAAWRKRDGCPEKARLDPLKRWEDHTAQKFIWGPCRHNTEIALWRLKGPGHVWPGGIPNYHPRALGPSTMVIDANEEIWAFFSRFTLPDKHALLQK